MPLDVPESVLSAPILSQFSLKDKLCFVTGGAQGFGLEIVRAFAEAGADVCFTYLTTSDDKATKTAQSIEQQTGRRILPICADVRKRSDIAAAMEQAVQAFNHNGTTRHLDVVVANAGVCRQISSLDYDEETFDKDYAVNVYGVMWTAQAAGRIFRKQGHGNLIITASVSSVLVNTPQPQTSYNSSKAAAAHMGKNLAVEWVDFARVNCVSPGYVATNSECSLRRC
jgi:sorbose reductase